MTNPNRQRNSGEKQLPAHEAQAELPAGPVEAKNIADPVADLNNSKNFLDSDEIMLAAVKDKILRVNESGNYAPADPNNTTAVELVRIFTEKENAECHTGHAAKSRKDIKQVVSAPKPKTKEHPKAQDERAHEVILFDPSEYHKLGLLIEEDKPLPQPPLLKALDSIQDPEKQKTALDAFIDLLKAHEKALEEKINQYAEDIKKIHTHTHLNEITDTLVKLGLLIRRGRTLIANPLFRYTEILEDAIRLKKAKPKHFAQNPISITLANGKTFGHPREFLNYYDKIICTDDNKAKNEATEYRKLLDGKLNQLRKEAAAMEQRISNAVRIYKNPENKNGKLGIRDLLKEFIDRGYIFLDDKSEYAIYLIPDRGYTILDDNVEYVLRWDPDADDGFSFFDEKGKNATLRDPMVHLVEVANKRLHELTIGNRIRHDKINGFTRREANSLFSYQIAIKIDQISNSEKITVYNLISIFGEPPILNGDYFPHKNCPTFLRDAAKELEQRLKNEQKEKGDKKRDRNK